ncbi:rho GTPase-activating protein 27-like [Trachypithecus francoisi]|uniref:rho GTPase-activating protein 27-like n=1 Tax=Trachypithecus francoisi TaxID=54180 RepID=UPI00141B8A11|nr:rho GTPase-activating protein 27-like [Trachypithecus francoisi]
MAADVEGDVYVPVVHAFEYTGKDGRRVAIPPNELYRPLWRSTEDRWHLRREPGGRPFYLPAQYVRELPALDNPATAAPPGPHPGPAAPEPLAYDYRFLSAAAAAVPSGPPPRSPERRQLLVRPCAARRRDPAQQPSARPAHLPVPAARGAGAARAVPGRPGARRRLASLRPPRKQRQLQGLQRGGLLGVPAAPGAQRLRERLRGHLGGARPAAGGEHEAGTTPGAEAGRPAGDRVRTEPGLEETRSAQRRARRPPLSEDCE